MPLTTRDMYSTVIILAANRKTWPSKLKPCHHGLLTLLTSREITTDLWKQITQTWYKLVAIIRNCTYLHIAKKSFDYCKLNYKKHYLISSQYITNRKFYRNTYNVMCIKIKSSYYIALSTSMSVNSTTTTEDIARTDKYLSQWTFEQLVIQSQMLPR